MIKNIMISRDIFTYNIIAYFRGNYSDINNIISPLSIKNYQEYNKILESMEKSCCFSEWYTNLYNKNMNTIISINKCLLFDDVDHNYLKRLYLDSIGFKYCVCHHAQLVGRALRYESHKLVICPKLAILNKMLEIENNTLNSFLDKLKKQDSERINSMKNSEKYNKYYIHKYFNKHKNFEKRYKKSIF